MPNPILIVHGWSDNYQSFVPLQKWLSVQYGDALQVFFANYDSMEDHVTFDDLAAGLQDRFDELESKGSLVLEPFSLDVVVHSTGGPVVRHWLNHYLMDKCKGDVTRCPIRRLIMLAPANFGSRLAAEGKTALARLFKGGVANGFETGELILDGLELGSPQLWDMAMEDMFSGKSFYPCVADKGPFVFVFSGTETYGKLKGLVTPGANEDGSDGTVRASAASLNSIKIIVNYCEPDKPKVPILLPQNNPIIFRLVPGVNHSEIVPRQGAPADHPTFQLIERCMKIETGAQYDELRLQFDQETKAFYASQGSNGVHAYQQFVIHVRDELNNDVPDYRMEFHVIDNEITKSNWNAEPTNLENSSNYRALQRYKDFTARFQRDVIADVAKHSVNPSYRTFFINVDELKSLKRDMAADERHPYIAMNFDAAGPTKDLAYRTDEIRYVGIEVPIPDSKGGTIDFFVANTTTLVEIQLLNVPTIKVIELIKA